MPADIIPFVPRGYALAGGPIPVPAAVVVARLVDAMPSIRELAAQALPPTLSPDDERAVEVFGRQVLLLEGLVAEFRSVFDDLARNR
jgi:hypothetical protein